MVRTAAIEKHLKTINHLLDFDQGGIVPDQERHNHKGDGQKQDSQARDGQEPDDQKPEGQAQEGQAGDGQEPDGQEQDSQGQDCEEDEGDTEFDLLKPYNTSQGKPLLPWESYRDWLRLQTIYFDATEVLARYVTPFALSVDISIKILSSSPPDDKMLSWEDLLCMCSTLLSRRTEIPSSTSGQRALQLSFQIHCRPAGNGTQGW